MKLWTLYFLIHSTLAFADNAPSAKSSKNFEEQLECILQESFFGISDKLKAPLEENLNQGGRGLMIEVQVTPKYSALRQTHLMAEELRAQGAIFDFEGRPHSRKRKFKAWVFDPAHTTTINNYNTSLVAKTMTIKEAPETFKGQKLSFPVQYQDLQVHQQIHLKDLMTLLNRNFSQTRQGILKLRRPSAHQQSTLMQKILMKKQFPKLNLNIANSESPWTDIFFEFNSSQADDILELLRAFPDWSLEFKSH